MTWQCRPSLGATAAFICALLCLQAAPLGATITARCGTTNNRWGKAPQPDVLRQSATIEHQYESGAVADFWVVNKGQDAQVTATCRYLDSTLAIYVADDVWFQDTEIQSGYVTGPDIRSIAAGLVRPGGVFATSRDYFGAEAATGVDGSPRISLLLYDIDNDYQLVAEKGIEDPGSWLATKGFVRGYTLGRDTLADGTYIYDTTATGVEKALIRSNERKMIYVDTYPLLEHGTANFFSRTGFEYNPIPTPDHSGDFSLDGYMLLPEGPQEVLATMAHEFQHLIHQSALIENGSGGILGARRENLWVKEGLADFSHYLSYRATTNLSSADEIIPLPRDHISSYLDNTNSNFTNWSNGATHYGGSFMYLLYLEERLATLLSTLQNYPGTERGMDAIDSILTDTFELSPGISRVLTVSFGLATMLDDQGNSYSPYSYLNIDLNNFDTTMTDNGDGTIDNKDGLDYAQTFDLKARDDQGNISPFIRRQEILQPYGYDVLQVLAPQKSQNLDFKLEVMLPVDPATEQAYDVAVSYYLLSNNQLATYEDEQGATKYLHFVKFDAQGNGLISIPDFYIGGVDTMYLILHNLKNADNAGNLASVEYLLNFMPHDPSAKANETHRGCFVAGSAYRNRVNLRTVTVPSFLNFIQLLIK